MTVYAFPERDKLEELLEKNFPKGKCRERGRALVMFAQYILWLEKYKEKKVWVKKVDQEIYGEGNA